MEAADLLINYNWEQNPNYKDILPNLQEGNLLTVIKKFPLKETELQSFIHHIGITLKEKRNNNGEDIFDVKIANQNNFSHRLQIQI
jgi:hypothetical protein